MKETRDRSNEVDDRPCGDCGREMDLVWFAPNALWNEVMGGPGTEYDPGGYICPWCFESRCRAAGKTLTWKADLVGNLEDPVPDVPESKIREEVARLRDRAQWANLSFAERESATYSADRLSSLLQTEEPRTGKNEGEGEGGGGERKSAEQRDASGDTPDVASSLTSEELTRENNNYLDLLARFNESQGKLEAAESRASRAEEALKQSEALVRMLRERSGPKKLDAAEAVIARLREWAERRRDGSFMTGLLYAQKEVLSLLDGDKATNATPQRSGGSSPEPVCPSCGIERAGECRDPWHGLPDDSLIVTKDQEAVREELGETWGGGA